MSAMLLHGVGHLYVSASAGDNEPMAVHPDKGITRADLATALADRVARDRRLAECLAIHEAWEAGYIADLLHHAEVLAALDEATIDQVPEHDRGELIDQRSTHAVSTVIDTINPFGVHDIAASRLTPDASTAVVNMLHAQAEFHRATVELDRRGLRRTPPPG